MNNECPILPRRHLLLAAGLALAFFFGGLVAPASAQKIYVSQGGNGSQNGASAANAYAMSWLTTSGNWGSGSGQVGPGVTVCLEGAITNAFSILGSGTPGHPITILFDTGAYMSSADWGGGSQAIYAAGVNYIVIDGGGTNNGAIFCTANGIGLANQVGATGISFQYGCSYCTVQNLSITNMYVQSGGILGSGAGEGIRFIGGSYNVVSNCLFHDENTGAEWTYAAGCAGLAMLNCTCYNCNWGGDFDDESGSSSLTGATVSGNHFYNWQSWDLPGNPNSPYHHNGFYAYAETTGSTMSNLVISGNIVGPGFSASTPNNSTSGLFLSTASGCVMTNVLIYNNVFLGTDGTAPANGFITAGIVGDIEILNNTFMGGNNGTGVDMGGGAGPTSTIYCLTNNLFENLSTYIAQFSKASYSYQGGYNLFYGSPAGQPFVLSASSSGQTAPLSVWTTYFDANSQTGPQALTNAPLYTPLAGGDAVDHGANLTGLGIAGLDKDIVGTVRDQDTNQPWTIGAGELRGASMEVTEVSQPNVGIPAGAEWQVDSGPLETNTATLTNLSVGLHVLSFAPVAGWITPGSEVVLVTNSPVNITATYAEVANTGGLQVTILPASVAAAGAEWQTSGWPSNSSGTALTTVAGGSYTINFSTNIAGWTPPPPEIVSVTNNQFTTVTNFYSQYSLHVVVPPTNDLNGLVLWLPCDTTTSGTTLDMSGNANTGTLTGQTLPAPVTGEIANALSYDGVSGYLDCGPGTSLGITGNITMAAWVNVAGFPTSSAIGNIIGKGFDGNNEGYFLRLRGNNGTPVVDAGSYTLTGSINYIVTWTITGWPTGTWHYLSATYDGSNWNLYFDGRVQASSAQPQGALASGEDVTIGAEYGPSIGRYFQGAIDDARIYNRALSAAEIADQYQWPTGSRP